MTQYILNGLALISIVVLALLFSKEKARTMERDNALKDSLVNSVKSLREEQQKSEEALDTAFTDGIEKISDLIDSSIQKTDDKIRLVSESVQASSEESRRLLKLSNDDINRKIELLTSALEQINKENASLRKKLEFFTEIDEDSKNINDTEDAAKREALIQQALKELSSINPDNSKSTEEPIQPFDAENEEKSARTIAEGAGKTTDVLDDEQKVAFRIMNETNENLFITGKAGTGKSFLLEMFVRGTKKNTITVAPTGIAALNVSGATIHSTFGFSNLEELSLDDISEWTIRLKSEKRQVLKEIDTLIIDEISMVRVDIFDKIDKILRVVNESAKPFGGKQVIVFGDLFQLPPIAKKQEEKYLTDYYGGIFFFNSNSFSNGNFGFIELTTNHRQKEDAAFFDILNRMREGIFTDADLNMLNDRLIHDKRELRRVMTLFPKKADAERVNREELARIEAKEYIYKAKILFNANNNRTPNLDLTFPFTEELHLKRGALVMMVANDPNKRWVNGTIAIAHSLYEDGIKVTIDGTTYDVNKIEFTQREATYERGRIFYKDVLTVEQYPLVLAYAITIHKSQGMTYKTIACDISKCFAPGQAYVALSRCSSMNGLYLLTKIFGTMIHSNRTVIDFYRSQSSEDTINRFS